MNLGTFSNSVYTFCNWFYRLAYLNILWILCTLLGMIFFGFFPATIALLSTLRKLIVHQNVNITKNFWHYYKKEFIQSNKLGFIILIFGFLVLINIKSIEGMDVEANHLLFYTTIILSSLYFLFCCYFLVSYVTFEQTIKMHIKNSILIMMYNPLSNIFIIFGCAAVYIANTYISGLSFFFSVSTLGLVILSSANIAYNKILKKQQSLSA